MRFRHAVDAAEQANVDMTPLIDVVFILLIFFILSASFQQQNQVNVDRPSSQTNDAVAKVNLMVSIDKQGQVWFDNQPTEIALLTSKIKYQAAQASHVSVIIDVDKTVDSGRLIQVVDKVRIAGVNNVAVATQS